MKRIMSLLFSITMIISLTACITNNAESNIINENSKSNSEKEDVLKSDADATENITVEETISNSEIESSTDETKIKDSYVVTPEPTTTAIPVETPKATAQSTPQPVCGVCGSASHTNHPTCAVCGSTSHTNHPTCPTCGSTDHSSHPVPTCEICGSYSHTQHPALNNDQIIEHQPQTGTNEASDGNAVLEE